MIKNIHLVHLEWKDTITIDYSNNRLNRGDDYASFKESFNILYIDWDRWGSEIFIKFEDGTYYLCKEIKLHHNLWNDICYIDQINNIIYRKSNNNIGYIKNETDDNIIIDWLDVNSPQQKIPNIIHFIYGFKEQIEEFDLYKYIAIKSAYDINKPDKIYLYYHYLPYGYWWNRVQKYITAEKIDLPDNIYGNKLCHYAHQSDIIRLKKLIEVGGIYLDIDTICLKSFSDLLDNKFVMGIQTNSDNSSSYGLCNAVILSIPNSPFAIKWLESYKDFRSSGRDQYWDEHSVLRPYYLSQMYPDEIKILKHNSFFSPLWYTINDVLFNENININNYKDIIENNYCIHLWDTYSNSYLKNITEEHIFKYNTLYNIFSRKFLKNYISIVFLTYNRYDMTKKCLDSYLKCLDNDYIAELIILDNNSDKDVVDYLNEFKKNNSKIKIIFSDENLGVCNGRIILFKEAIGDIIISLDSDAYLINNNFFERVIDMLYDERYGIIGISGAYIRGWEVGDQEDINDADENEYCVDHIAGCCQAFRRDLYNFGFGLDPFYGKFWVEDTDLSMQSLNLKKVNYRINPTKYLEHNWGGSGKDFKDLFLVNWNYFSNKWKNKIIINNK